jgi:hypothetical protein
MPASDKGLDPVDHVGGHSSSAKPAMNWSTASSTLRPSSTPPRLCCRCLRARSANGGLVPGDAVGQQGERARRLLGKVQPPGQVRASRARKGESFGPGHRGTSSSWATVGTPRLPSGVE